MATFKFDHDIDIHWNGYDIVGPAETVFSIPDQLYEEFESDLRSVEPSLTWLDTNEFQTLSNSVSAATLSATFPIALTTSTTGKTISLSSSTNPNGYLLAADGSGGVIFTPASTSGLTSVVGVSPISTAITGGTVSVILNASYQTAGTYVNAVIGTSPASVVTASGTSTVSIDQAAITGATAATNAQTVRTYVKNTTGTTIPAYSAVYVSGATGDNALIALSTASTEVGSSKTLGITAESIANDAFGYVIESGYLAGINTTGVTAGSSIWLGNTPGSLVFGAPPAEPSHSVYLGVVIREQQNNGSILVKVQNGYELDELHDVSAGSPTDLDILQYKSSSALWTKASIANAGIAASVHTHDYQASGTYVNAVIGTSPASVSTASGTSTVSISSGTATNGQVLTADGSGGVSFTTSSGFSLISSQTISTGVSTVAKPANAKIAFLRLISGGNGGNLARRTSTTGQAGSAGGNGGGRAEFWVSASDFSSTINYSVGAGGSGAVGSAYTSSTYTSGSLIGTSGGSTSFGPYSSRSSLTIPYVDANESIGGIAGSGTTNAVGGYSGYHTAGGGASGGGTGGSVGTSSDGGTVVSKWVALSAGGGAAAGASSVGATGSGAAGTNASVAGGGGGGGGSKYSTASLTANCASGNGGNGLYPGGGGGAAGATMISAVNISTFTLTVGNGGNGADGQIYVEWYG